MRVYADSSFLKALARTCQKTGLENSTHSGLGSTRFCNIVLLLGGGFAFATAPVCKMARRGGYFPRESH